MRAHVRPLVVLLIWIASLAPTPTLPPVKETPAADKPQLAHIVVDHDIAEENSPAIILQDVLRGTGIPAGAAQITACSDSSKARLNVKHGTSIEAAMDAFVASNPNYQWLFDHGAIDLIPRRRAALLDTRIADFHMDTTDKESATIVGQC